MFGHMMCQSRGVFNAVQVTRACCRRCKAAVPDDITWVHDETSKKGLNFVVNAAGLMSWELHYFLFWSRLRALRLMDVELMLTLLSVWLPGIIISRGSVLEP